MAFTATKIHYQQTGFFSKTVIDYLTNEKTITPFFKHRANKEGLQNCIRERRNYHINRQAVADILNAQYKDLPITDAVSQNIELLKKDTTFSITTAHQPNLFTGPLYFVYKILHAVKLAAYCKREFPEYDFVPVFYMGSEDADLDELGHVYINGEKLIWETEQTGTVGRMLIDKNLLKIIERISGEVGVQPFGKEIVSSLKENYKEGATIQDATLRFVNHLFGKFGLIVVQPDCRELKALAVDFFKEELLNSHSLKITEETGQLLADAGYGVQAYSRDINFFYMKDHIRERIEKEGSQWKVLGTDITFNKEQLLEELQAYPERFSPNVILRGIFQEIILPNIAYIGGGGELAYWLQLKSLFEYYKVPYPVLILRNSFLIIDAKNNMGKNKLGFSDADIFKSVEELQKEWVQKNTVNDLGTSDAIQSLDEVYKQLGKQAETIDSTLLRHIENIKSAGRKRIIELGKKMLKAEKRNHNDVMRRIAKLKRQLFPGNSLQERVDNFIPYYAKLGPRFFDVIYENSLTLEPEFVILEDSGVED